MADSHCRPKANPPAAIITPPEMAGQAFLLESTIFGHMRPSENTAKKNAVFSDGVLYCLCLRLFVGRRFNRSDGNRFSRLRSLLLRPLATARAVVSQACTGRNQSADNDVLFQAA